MRAHHVETMMRPPDDVLTVHFAGTSRWQPPARLGNARSLGVCWLESVGALTRSKRDDRFWIDRSWSRRSSPAIWRKFGWSSCWRSRVLAVC